MCWQLLTPQRVEQGEGWEGEGEGEGQTYMCGYLVVVSCLNTYTVRLGGRGEGEGEKGKGGEQGELSHMKYSPDLYNSKMIP